MAGNPAWVKGVAQNPAGRPKGSYEVLRDSARAFTAEALQTLVDAMRQTKSGKLRVLAADKILDRGWGKALGADGEGFTGNVVIQVITGIDRSPLPEDAKPITDVQPMILEHEPNRTEDEDRRTHIMENESEPNK